MPLELSMLDVFFNLLPSSFLFRTGVKRESLTHLTKGRDENWMIQLLMSQFRFVTSLNDESVVNIRLRQNNLPRIKKQRKAEQVKSWSLLLTMHPKPLVYVHNKHLEAGGMDT